jgi:CotS family spore coat protein
MAQLAEADNHYLLSEENVKKYVLPQFGLEGGEVSQIKFKDTDKQRAVYRIDVNDMTYCLKKVYFQEPDLLFVYSAIEWFYRTGINVPRLLPTKTNGRYIEYNNMLFILMPWIDGVKCDYDNIEHVLTSSSVLAKMHKYTHDFHPITGSNEREGFDNILYSLQKHFQQILTCSNYAFRHNDRFSKIFLQHFDSGVFLAKNAVKIASTINLNNLTKALCHLDFVNKNIILDNSSDLWVIDFDKCKMDYCVHDIAYFLRRIMKRDNTKWDLDLATQALESYEKVRPINIDEYKFLMVYLSFPQKYWKISRDYYNNIRKCNKNAFITLLNKSVEKNDYQTQFIGEFKEYIENKFNAHID